MKQFLSIIFITLTANLWGQNYTVDVRGEYTPEGTILIWHQKDCKALWHAMTYGYTIERSTTVKNGKPLGADRIKGTSVRLGKIAPYTSKKWDALINQGNPLAHIAKDITNRKTLRIKPKTLAQAIEYEENLKARQFLLLTLALKDKTIAKGLGNFFIDKTAKPNNKYVYTVHLNGGNNLFDYTPGNIAIDPSKSNDYYPIDFELLPKDSSCLLRFHSHEPYRDYFGYNIYSSMDSIAFRKVNEAPILFSESNEQTNHYQIPLHSNESKQYIFIRGVRISGIEGPASKVVGIQGIPDPEVIHIKQYKPQETQDLKTIITWDLPKEEEINIKGFNVLRKFKKADKFVAINSEIISSSLREFTDKNPLFVNYYSIEVIDKHGHSHRSFEILHQPSDDEPPKTPANLTGKQTDYKQILIRWDKNDEKDCHGYKIYMSNSEKGEFLQINKEVIQDTTFEYFMNTSVLQKSIYFAVRAVDYRDNISEMTLPLKVKIQDITPPSTPNLYRIESNEHGILIQWEGSQSKDCKRHRIQRRMTGFTIWDDIYKVEHSDSLFINKRIISDVNEYYSSIITNHNTYLDTIDFKNTDYEYRIKAEDFDNNSSYSDILSVKPLKSNIKGTIENFETYVLKKNPELLKSIYKLNDTQKSSSICTGKYIGILKWDYSYSDKKEVAGFQLYRSINKNPFKKYRFIPYLSYYNLDELPLKDQDLAPNMYNKTEYAFIDLDLMENNTVEYKIIAIHKNGSTSNFSLIKKVKLEE